MANERLTPFERLDAKSDPQFKLPQNESVDQLILQRKAYKKRLRKIKWLKRLGVLILTFFLSLLSTAYVVSPMSKIQQITVLGNRMLSKQELLETLSLSLSQPIYNLDFVDLNNKLKDIDFIESASVSLRNHNAIQIVVTEKRGVALIVLSTGLTLVTDEAEFIEMDAHRLLMNLNLPLIVGMDDAQEISDLAYVLSTLNDEILVNISEIHKEKTAFNEAQMRLMMQEGNMVFAPLSALSALDKYLQVIKMTNATHSCFYIADSSFSVVKQECPTY